MDNKWVCKENWETGGVYEMTQEIYGWHIIHTETGIPYAFCSAAGGMLDESDVLDGFTNPEDFTLIPLVKAGTEQ